VDTEAIDCEDGVLRILTLGLRSDSRERATGRRGTFRFRPGLFPGAAGEEDDVGGVSSSSVLDRILPNIVCDFSPVSKRILQELRTLPPGLSLELAGE
jgi:hypothetical protein